MKWQEAALSFSNFQSVGNPLFPFVIGMHYFRFQNNKKTRAGQTGPGFVTKLEGTGQSL
jgi:hypothetical protein